MNRTRALLSFLSVTCLATFVRAEVTISFAVPHDSRTSLAICDRKGRMVQTLLTGKPLATGQHQVTWDGLDRYGYSLPAGEYTWKVLATRGLRAEFITQVGQNVDPPWERATGNHESPSSVAIDATGLYRIGATNEGAHWGVKTDLSGRHVWVNDRWSADPWVQGTVAVTLVKERLFELMPNGHVYGYDARTGRLFTGGDFDPKPWSLCWERFQVPAGVGQEVARRQLAAQSPRDLVGDSANNLLVAAYPQHDAVAWFSAKDGSLVDSAKGLTALAGSRRLSRDEKSGGQSHA